MRSQELLWDMEQCTVLVPFLVAGTQHSDKSYLKEEWLIVAHCSSTKIHHGWKPERQELEAAGHTTPTTRKQRI